MEDTPFLDGLQTRFEQLETFTACTFAFPISGNGAGTRVFSFEQVELRGGKEQEV